MVKIDKKDKAFKTDLKQIDLKHISNSSLKGK